MFTASTIVVAKKTIIAINSNLASDQGNKYRAILRETMPQAEDAYANQKEGFRTHLGASLIGKECPRAVWYAFRWAHDTRFEGRMIRLFNRGHLEEPRFVALLRMIGCEVWQYDAAGKQFRVKYHSGHFGGSLDSVVRGVPDDPQRPVLGEYKTHNQKSFDKLAGSNWRDYVDHFTDPKKPKATFTGKGVREAKFEHFIQMQTYMNGYQLPRALYLAVNKNDDDIYAELVDYDHEQFLRYHDRADQIIFGNSPPKKVSESPGWFSCKFCDYNLICHKGNTPAVNCRTCIHSKPTRGSEDGEWYCDLLNRNISKQEQLAACPQYRWRPDF